jgi:hypothetical protein
MLNNKNPDRGGLAGVALATLAIANRASAIKRVLSRGNARRIGAVALVAFAGSAAVAAYAVYSTLPGRIQIAPVSLVVHSAATLPAEVRAVPSACPRHSRRIDSTRFFAKSIWCHAINRVKPAETRWKSVSRPADSHAVPPIWRVQASRSPDSHSIHLNDKRAE